MFWHHFFLDNTWIFFNRVVPLVDIDTQYLLLEELPQGVSARKKHQIQSIRTFIEMFIEMFREFASDVSFCSFFLVTDTNI